jgi:hypothetical protein
LLAADDGFAVGFLAFLDEADDAVELGFVG